MARLTESDKEALLRGTHGADPSATVPRLPLLSPREYIEFATKMARLTRSAGGKVKRFVPMTGEHWKL